MSPQEPALPPASAGVSSPGLTAPVTAAAPAKTSPRRGLAAAPGLLVAVGLLGGLAAGLLVIQFGESFQPGEGSMPAGTAVMALMGDHARTRELRALEASLRRKNTILAFGLIGAVLAGAFGLCEGLAARSGGAVAIGGLVGLSLGGVLGGLGGIAALAIEERLQATSLAQMYRTLAVQATAFGLIGLAVGVSTFVHTRRPRTMGRAMLAAVAGAVIAAALYVAAGAALVFVSNSNLDQAVPAGAVNRLVWTGLLGLMLGLLIGVAREPGPPAGAH